MAQPLLEPPRRIFRLNAAEFQSRTVVNELWEWCERLVEYLNLRFTHDGARTLMEQRLRALELRADALEQENQRLTREVSWLTILTRPLPPTRSVPV